MIRTVRTCYFDVGNGYNFCFKGWGEVSPEEIVDGTHDPLYVYLGSKILAEKAAWKFAEGNGELDLATSMFLFS